MNIVIFGSTGPNGCALVEQGLQQGHKVTAFARNPAALEIKHENLLVAKGDILEPASVSAAIQGRDAVLSALGTKTLKKNTIMSDGTRNIIAAMKAHNVRRLIVETSLEVGDSRGQSTRLFRWIFLPLLLRNVFADKEIQEREIMASGLDWTIVRPGMLTNGPRTGEYQVWTGAPPPATRKSYVSRADVADFMLKQLTDSNYLRKAVGMTY
jgi:putative NADH-flavin reductase